MRFTGAGRKWRKMRNLWGDAKRRGNSGRSVGSATQRCKARRTSRGGVRSWELWRGAAAAKRWWRWSQHRTHNTMESWNRIASGPQQIENIFNEWRRTDSATGSVCFLTVKSTEMRCGRWLILGRNTAAFRNRGECEAIMHALHVWAWRPLSFMCQNLCFCRVLDTTLIVHIVHNRAPLFSVARNTSFSDSCVGCDLLIIFVCARTQLEWTKIYRWCAGSKHIIVVSHLLMFLRSSNRYWRHSPHFTHLLQHYAYLHRLFFLWLSHVLKRDEHVWSCGRHPRFTCYEPYSTNNPNWIVWTEN